MKGINELVLEIKHKLDQLATEHSAHCTLLVSLQDGSVIEAHGKDANKPQKKVVQIT